MTTVITTTTLGMVSMLLLSLGELTYTVAHTTTPPGHGLATSVDDWDWSKTHTWALINTNGLMGAAGLLSDYQARFYATTYDIVGVGGTFGEACNKTHACHGEAAQAATAKQLKDINPNVKVIIYRNSALNIDGQLQATIEFDKHPEWLLRNTSGQPIDSPTQQWFDFTNEDCRNWWINSTIDALTDVYTVNGSVIDGVFIDGGGDVPEVIFDYAHLPPGKPVALNASHALAVRELTARVHALRPGMFTVGNGAVMNECGRLVNETMDWQPCARNLDGLDGACAEHFGSFGSVNTTSGNFNQIDPNSGGRLDMEMWGDALDIVQRYPSPTPKAILVKAWPGPFDVYKVDGRTVVGTWKNFSDHNITLTNTMKKEHGAAALAWSHAAYLLTVAPGSYMSYAWWYQSNTGYVPCPEAPTSCACPDDWYPDLKKATGKPLGPRTRVAGGTGHMWSRVFEQVSVTVDLGNFSDVSIVWKV